MAKDKHVKISEAIKKIRESVQGKKTKFSEIKLGQMNNSKPGSKS